MKKHLPILIILTIAALTRSYKITSPVADWHSWRQADTASVSHRFLKNGIDLLRPTYHDLSNIPSGQPNPQGYRMVEFPLFNAAHASLARLMPVGSLDLWGRALSVAFSLVSIYFLYLIVNHLSSPKTALLSALVLALMPFNIFYSRTILPEPLMLALTLAGSYYFLRLLSKPSVSKYLASSLLLSASLLVKPFAIFFFLPLLTLAFARFKFSLLKKPHTYLYLLILFAPLLAWRVWIQNFPAGIPANAWLFNLDNIRLRPAWWRWLFGERLARLILGYWGLPLFVLGVLRKPLSKETWYYHFWLIGGFAYLLIFAGGNVTHDYYQFILTPLIAVFVSKGLLFLFSTSTKLIRPLNLLLAITCLALMIGLSWYQIREKYKINNPPIIKAGRSADQLLPENAKVIAPYNGDTAFLYQTKRQGWPAVTTDLEKLINRGATHYVSVNYDQTTAQVLNNPDHQVLERTDQYLIVKLN